MATPKKKQVRRGRRWTLTAEMAKKIQMMVLMGVSPREAAFANGLHPSGWYNAVDASALGEDEEITERMQEIMIAEADFISRKEAQLAGVTDWKAVHAILKARRPDVYGDRIQTSTAPPVDSTAVLLSRDELIEEAKRRGLPTSIFAKGKTTT